MLDSVTLRVCFSLIALCLLVLFYVTTYRVTRSPFSGWWCLALTLFITAAVAWLLNGTAAQVVANPLGNVLCVTGSATVWLAARSLHRPPPPWWVVAIVPAITAVAAALGDPAHDVWAGGAVFLAAMALNLGFATWETWRAWRSAPGVGGPGHNPVTTTLTAASAAMSLYYLGRSVVFVAVGPEDALFVKAFGTTPTTLITLVMLVTVSHSMGALSQQQILQELRHRATTDDLTGMLHRQAFWSLADQELRGVERAAVIVADLDHFKQINDDFGHKIGDDVLVAFSAAVRESIRSTDLVSRFGGEEFVLLLPGASVEAAQVIARSINRSLRDPELLPDGRPVTASYGVAPIDAHTTLVEAVNLADEALYAAKQAGRDRVVIAGQPVL